MKQFGALIGAFILAVGVLIMILFTQGGGFSANAIPGLVLWLRADGIVATDTGGATPATADGDVVKFWGDLSGNGRNAIGSAVVGDPVLKLNVLNGKPVIRFGGSATQLLSVPSQSGLDVTSFTWFVVSKTTANSAGADNNIVPFMKNASAANANGIYFGVQFASNGEGDFEVARSGTDTYATSPAGTFPKGTFFTWAATFDQTTMTGYKNATAVATAAISGPADASTGDLTIGGYDHSFRGNSYGVEDIAEIILFDNVISAPDQAKVFTYLKTKYAHY